MDYIITITLNTDNADQDILRILQNVPFHITDIIAGRTTGKTLIDINGNNVGQITTVINKPEETWTYCEPCETRTRTNQEDSALSEFPIQECSICGTQL